MYRRFSRLLILTLLTSVCTFTTQASAVPLPTVTSANTLTVTAQTATSINGISITNASGIVPVQLHVSHGTLAISTTTGLTLATSTSGATLNFKGSQADVNAALASLTYTSNGYDNDTIEVALVDYGEVFYAANGHLYEYRTFDGTQHYTWAMAKAEADSLSKYGAQGYLATITSQGENDFINARVLGAGWMGATDQGHEGNWQWVDGPENGQQFWQGTYTGSPTNAMFNAWEVSQPDNSFGTLGFQEYENCAQFGLGASLTGKWNDLPCSLPLPGYVVEYGAPGNLPTVISRNISITPVDTDAVSNAVEDAAPHNGDANNDGIADSQQPFVASTTNPVTNAYISLTIDPSCTVSALSTTAHQASGGYAYPAGFSAFTADCSTPGASTNIELYYYGLPAGVYTARYYNPTTQTYTVIPNATVTAQTIAGQAVTVVSYTVTDGGPLDEDGTANGTIVDPIGLAVAQSVSSGQVHQPVPSNPNMAQTAATTQSSQATTLVITGQSAVVPILAASALSGFALITAIYRRKRALR